MKVLKFGGTSVGTPESISSVKRIVESQKEQVVVVVSALGGITDKLLGTAAQAASGDSGWLESFEQIRSRHLSMADAVIPQGDRKEKLKQDIENLHNDLRDLYRGLNLVQDTPKRVMETIVSFGERISSRIAAELIDGAVLMNSMDFIKTTVKGRGNVVSMSLTNGLIKEAFKDFTAKVALVPGFISTDATSGAVTNLGRGGSDYTAALLAAALDASILEIWTDVDGFMTADPRIIKTSYVIDELSYGEAMELCNFGAKVVYPPTLYPVCAKDIPIVIKNTFNPEAPGTVIKRDAANSDSPVTGISSISDTCLITIAGISMMGIPGIDGRIFGTLAENNISVFLASQSSSETGITLGVKEADADLAKELLDKEFEQEIETGAMSPVALERSLATVAVVGRGMKKGSNIAGRLFGTLGRNGISILACAQGSSDSNISIVVEKAYLRKTLNVIHDSFFLSENQELNLFVCGVGTVGRELLRQIASQRERLAKERNLRINVVGVIRSTKAVFNRDGIDPAAWEDALAANGIAADAATVKEQILGMNVFNAVFVDCTASAEVAGLYEDMLSHSISVVAANKVAASSEYENYRRLKDLARQKNVKYLFETNAGAGLPIISTINTLCNSGDHIEKIEAVLSGTLNFIFNTISEEIPFSKAVKMAQDAGFAEPDPRIDLSGKDVIRKLVILSREAGCKVNQSDVKASLFIPADFFDCTLDEFWKRLPDLDADFEARRKEIAAKGMKWRFVATMDAGKCSVALRAVDPISPFHQLEGSCNIVLLTTERYHNDPMLIQGYGAGAAVTAAGVFGDIMSIANI